MKPFQLLTAFFCIFLFMSCQKGVDWFDQPLTTPVPPPPPPAAGDTTLQLVRMVETDGSVDSVVTMFYYNAANKLIKATVTGQLMGSSSDNLILFTRDAQNRLVKFEEYDKTGPQLDSFQTIIVYTPGTNNVLYSIGRRRKYFDTDWKTDSTVYQYSNGSIQKALTFFSASAGELMTYNYDGSGNIVTSTDSTVDFTNGNRTHFETVTYQFDNKKSPFHHGNEALLTIFGGSPDLAGPNNNIFYQDRSGNYTYTYTYNSKGYPVSAVTSSPLDPPTTQKFYYK